MDSAYWFLPLTATGITATTVAHCVTLVGLAEGSAIEGNPFAFFLNLGKLSIPIASSIIGAAYLVTWMVSQRPGRTQSDTLTFRACVIGMTFFFLFDMIRDLVVVF
jgi:hypothetical protein